MGIDEYLKMVGKEEGLEQGRKEERENSSRLFVENLLSSTDFPIGKIASLANVTIEFVNEIKRSKAK